MLDKRWDWGLEFKIKIMKNYIGFILILFLAISSISANAQNYADKKNYLVDSLDLSIISNSDLVLVDSCLKIYHTANHDTTKINAINTIVENSWDINLWPKYNNWVYHFIEKKLSAYPISPDESIERLDSVKFTLHKYLAHALYNFGYFYDTQGDALLSLEYYHKSLKAYEEIDNKNGMANSYMNIGYIHEKQGDIPLAIKYYHENLKLREEIGDKQGMANAYHIIGYIHENQGDIPLALEYYHKSLQLREKIGDKQGMAQSYNNVGMIHKIQGDSTLALEYYLKSLKIAEEIGEKQGIAASYNNIGMIYKDQGDIPLALEYYHKSLKAYEEIDHKKGMANSYHNIGLIYHDQEDIPHALKYYHKSLKIKEEIEDKQGVANTLANLGTVYLDQGKLVDAKKMGLYGFQLAQELGFPDQIGRNARLLTKVYIKEGNYKLAFDMRNLEFQMRDSLRSEENIKATIQQQAKFEYEKQQAIKDAEHEKQIVIEQEEKEKQQIITYATAGGLVLVILFSVFVFNRLQVTKKQKLIIEEQKYEVEAQKAVVEKAHTELEEKNKEITDSITYAKRIQNAILPSDKTVKEYLPNNFVLYIPKDIIAGDFYWMEHKDDNILFAAADCTGHGVPGAMVSVVCNNALNRSVREYGLTNPAEILNKTREIVVQEFEKSDDDVKDGMDISLCSLDFNNQTLKWCGANNPLWIVRKGKLIETKPDKQPIGKVDNPQSFTTHTIELQKGDTIYIFTDGFADQFGGEKGKKFMYKPFKELLLSIQEKTMDEQKIVLEQHFESWRRSLEQVDDVCVIGIRV